MQKILFIHSYKYFIRILFVFSLISFSSLSKGQILDQSQLVYTGGMSARTLNGYSEWQSFKAGLNGTLTEIKIGFFNYINGAIALKVFAGTGTGGNLLYSKNVNMQCAAGNCLLGFPVSVPSIAGNVYTFQVIPGAGMPDPYGVQVQMSGTYAGGHMGLVDPSGTYHLNFDMVFQTYVKTTFPVKLFAFSGENIANYNQLQWSTESELNNQMFVVEKSDNSKEFNPIGTIHSAGNSTVMHHYQFIDYALKSEDNYYRLKQIDNNGSFTYSPIIFIKNKLPHNPFVSITSTSLYTYQLSLLVPQYGYICLYDLNGILIKKISVQTTDSNIKIDIENDKSGMYFLQIKSNKVDKTFKIFKLK